MVLLIVCNIYEIIIYAVAKSYRVKLSSRTVIIQAIIIIIIQMTVTKVFAFTIKNPMIYYLINEIKVRCSI